MIYRFITCEPYKHPIYGRKYWKFIKMSKVGYSILKSDKDFEIFFGDVRNSSDWASFLTVDDLELNDEFIYKGNLYRVELKGLLGYVTLNYCINEDVSGIILPLNGIVNLIGK